MPLLLRGLELPDNEIRASVIDTLQAAATSAGKDNTLLAEHAASLVSTMLKNSMVSHMPSVVRTHPVLRPRGELTVVCVAAGSCGRAAIFGHAAGGRQI